MNDTTYRPVNYVDAEPGVAMPRADIIRRGDVVDQVGRLIDVYQEQQRAALATVQADATRGGYLSDANQVAERRKTSRLYLLTYAGVSALTMAGLVILAALAGALNTPASIAVWLTGTGIVTLVLAWVRHGNEFEHSPEGIARHVVNAHWDLSSYEAETRRLSLQWEYAAEQRRQQAAAQAATDARQQAADRVREIEARRQMQAERFATQQAETWNVYQPIVMADAEPDAGAVTSWHDDLVAWVGELFATDGMTAAGVIKGRVPWPQRSEWAPADKEAARRVCCSLRPALIVQADGGRWRWKLELADSAETALRILTPRLQAD